ncbi:hypothetical protein CCAX7_000430 [Capsulimonas corticalis]|uniref:Uncharacterized protein n=1 Tax=Capsulimonas corticalis TaxID=2219043 RepID=A0A402CRB0_9BACT|nr:hypothetical protein [Capsulimonas corticalis]BDI27992.1 hypothetical protein CCAX7_000430 [Capsulimonas corticalis]
MSTTDYTIWPTSEDVQLRLSHAGVTLRNVNLARRFQQAMDGVTAEVARKTKRQFLPGAAGEVRIYDGTGTAEMEIDEIVSLTSVAVVGIQSAPGYTLTDVQLIQEQNKPLTRLVVARGSVPAFISEGVIVPYPSLFPAGRQNILVTGQFGYGAEIPHDLWDAVCGEVARRLTAEAIFSPGGQVSVRKAGDEEERYKLPTATDAAWGLDYAAKLADYTRPAGKRLRNMRPRMI